MTAHGDAEVSYVDSNEQLAACCESWARQSALALDTEFVRTNTFYSNLGLLQVADESGCFLVDPLVIDDWECFKDLFRSRDICFVLHSCGEDLNLFTSFFGLLPERIFDTQLAAAFLGTGFSLSYQALAELTLGVQLPKSETRSDWLRRPLSATQLQYAAADVEYLLELKELQEQQLIDHGLLAWFQQECRETLAQAALTEDPASWQSMYANISNAWRLPDRSLLYLQRLCVWREQEARARNKPKNWIAKDAELLQIADKLSDSAGQGLAVLEELSLDRRMLGRYGKKLLQAVEDESLSSDAIDRSKFNLPLTGLQRKQLKACQQLVKDKAEEIGMAPEILGRKRWLTDLILQCSPEQLLSSTEESHWRLQILGKDLHRILSQ